MKKILPALLAYVLLLIAAASAAASDQQELTVSAAISLKNAFADIGKAFEELHRDMKIVFNFGASGDLMTQIKGGAPVDLFASASEKDMDALDRDGLVLGDSRADFTSNAVVLVRPAASKLPLASFGDLKRPEVRKIAIGDPASVPAGRYADETLKYLKLHDALRDKLIFGANVRQVLDYVARNEVDAGVVYATDARTRPQEVVVVSAAPKGSHKPILYPIAVVKGSGNEKAAREFIAFLRSSAGQAILLRYGFAPLP